MQDLIDAIEIRKKYNRMTLGKFVKEYEKFYKVQIPREAVDRFGYTGLNNVDFLGIIDDILKELSE